MPLLGALFSHELHACCGRGHHKGAGHLLNMVMRTPRPNVLPKMGMVMTGHLRYVGYFFKKCLIAKGAVLNHSLRGATIGDAAS